MLGKRALKDYDPRTFNDETGEVFFKPTDSLFDYLSDHQIVNHVFGDDVRREGFYEHDGSLHVVVSQPFINGRHDKSSAFISRLEQAGLQHDTGSRFFVDGGPAGILQVIDMHEDNVLFDRLGQAYVIDVHFRFPSRAARIEALKALGLGGA